MIAQSNVNTRKAQARNIWYYMQQMQHPAARERGMATLQEREFYTVTEAARLLDVSRTTIWRWINDGRLGAYRVGGRTIRIRRQDVRKMLRPTRDDIEEKRDIWANYDPTRALEALRACRGMLRGVDREQLLKDIHNARGQDSTGRPA